MPYVPSIRDYKPFYVQAFSDGTARDTREWGLVAKSQPYPLSVKVKDPYKNTWFDEDGDDEYTDAEARLESFEHEVKFYIETRDSGEGGIEGSAAYLLKSQLNGFLSFMRKAGKHGFYDSSVQVGYKDVRLGEMSVPEDHTKDRDGRAWMVLAVKFKVNDPSATAQLRSNGDGTVDIV